MKINTNQLIQDLERRTHNNIKVVENYRSISDEKLNYKSSKESWSVLECIEHLNLYGDFYIPEIQNRLKKNTTSSKDVFKSGLLGNYFAKSMLPKEKLNKMKTFADKNPVGSSLSKNVLDRFLEQQQKMLSLLDQSRKVNLNKTKTSISISKLIKLKLGDTFRVVIFHNDRHILQAENILKNL